MSHDWLGGFNTLKKKQQQYIHTRYLDIKVRADTVLSGHRTLTKLNLSEDPFFTKACTFHRGKGNHMEGNHMWDEMEKD